ncbi:TPR domain protein [Aspergillus uvarum CBS 121591]|uniref:TPR domain protein n=1 Tax=Aspergillus uvarum CBS 121591 TaxID=1448315 RepID=A0A319BVA1_9EURO|nr:TPR domain protein [Aspergillus uvarum CBS 121591]PYH76157.1 TPR domain protein [Aspergillus uvarum CBS 121591]
MMALTSINQGRNDARHVIEVKTSAKSRSREDILDAFKKLPVAQQRLYLDLHEFACPQFRKAAEREIETQWEEMTDLDRKVLAIFAANAFNGGVFPLGSRMNHSCIPNTDFSYNWSIEKETFHAIRDIRAGEELTIMYTKLTNRDRIKRQVELDKWGFRCTCLACEDTPQGWEREQRRMELFDLDQRLAINMQFGGKETYKESSELALRMAAIQKSEGLLNRELGISYHDAARYCLAMGNVKMALLWAEKELELDICCVGRDHPDYEKEAEMVNLLREAVSASKPVHSSVMEWLKPHSVPEQPCVVM